MAPKRTGTILARSAVKRTKDPSKALKREQKRLEEREDEKVWWDRVERFAGKLLEPRVLASIGGGVLGAIAFNPVRFDLLHSELVDRQTVYDPRGIKDQIGYQKCVQKCISDYQGQQWPLIVCIAGCQVKFGAEAILGERQWWDLEFRVLCNLHSIVPNLSIDAGGVTVDLPWPLPDFTTPGIHWSLRETLAFNFRMVAPAQFQPVDSDPNIALNRAIEGAKQGIRQKLVLIGAAGGFAGTLTLPEILKGVGEVLRGVGEIVPG